MTITEIDIIIHNLLSDISCYENGDSYNEWSVLIRSLKEIEEALPTIKECLQNLADLRPTLIKAFKERQDISDLLGKTEDLI